MAKGKIFKTEFKDRYCCSDMIDKIEGCIDDIRHSVRCTVAISKGSMAVGYGIKNSDKNIACENAITLIKEIKKIKGW